jgi:CRP-like cAMP-binding protein
MKTESSIALKTVRNTARGSTRTRPQDTLATTDQVNFTPEKVGAQPEKAAGFTSRFLLANLACGKSRREYVEGETVFSQGDPANAVFYIQTGRIKLTVVSASGKEAVVAMLPEANFFGEGCLAGQPLRMATAGVLKRSIVVRIEKAAMVALLHSRATSAWKRISSITFSTPAKNASLVCCC